MSVYKIELMQHTPPIRFQPEQSGATPRAMLGFEADMMVDFLYCFKGWQDARWVLKRIEDVDLCFAEAVLDHDDLEGHARLSIAQPDYNRCGGLTELRRIVEIADTRIVQVMLHNWKTGITAKAALHYHISCRNAKYVEYLSPEFYDGSLRKNLVAPETPVIDGGFTLDESSGLGIDINREFFKEVTALIFTHCFCRRLNSWRAKSRFLSAGLLFAPPFASTIFAKGLLCFLTTLFIENSRVRSATTLFRNYAHHYR